MGQGGNLSEEQPCPGIRAKQGEEGITAREMMDWGTGVKCPRPSRSGGLPVGAVGQGKVRWG